MVKKQRPQQKQRRDNPTKVYKLAAALFWLAQFIYIVLGIIKLWNELTG